MKCPVCGSDIGRGSEHCDVCGSDFASRTRQRRAHAKERLPYDTDVEIDESTIQRSTVAELKETKAAYKEARRNAGKSNVPKVIAVFVAMLVAAAAGAFATWYFMNGDFNTKTIAMQEELYEAQNQAQSARAEVEALEQEIEGLQEKIALYEKALAEAAVENALSPKEGESQDDAKEGSQAAGRNEAASSGAESASSSGATVPSDGRSEDDEQRR